MQRLYCDLWDGAYFEKQYTFLAPHPGLAASIASYWVLDLRDQASDIVFGELLSAGLTSSVVFNLGTPFFMGDAGKAGRPYAQSVVLGYHSRPLLYQHHAGNLLIGVKLKPPGLWQLFGQKAVDNAEAVVKTSTLFPHVQQLERQLREASCLSAIGQALDTAFAALPSRSRPWDSYIAQFFDEQFLEGAQYQFKRVAHGLYLTPRTLNRYFSTYFSMTPKQCLKILRFRKGAQAYHAVGYRADWTALGYTDFSHFRKEWKTYFPFANSIKRSWKKSVLKDCPFFTPEAVGLALSFKA